MMDILEQAIKAKKMGMSPKKVTVMAPDKEGLEEGLEKAEEVLEQVPEMKPEEKIVEIESKMMELQMMLDEIKSMLEPKSEEPEGNPHPKEEY